MAEKEFVASVTIPLTEYNSMKGIYDAFNKDKKVYCTAWDHRGVFAWNESEIVKVLGELLIASTKENSDWRVKYTTLEEKLNKKPFP